MDTLIEEGPIGLKPGDVLIKRIFDIVVSLLMLVVTWPIIVTAWFLATLDTGYNGFFVQKRVGRFGKCFPIIKIRTMRLNSGSVTCVTTSDDPRITKLGRFFRKTKIDELPQLINVLKGDMSFVGPRPDVPGFADKLLREDRIVLSLRPGITGPATLMFRNEEKLLAGQEDPEKYNQEVIYPEKVRLNKQYIRSYSFFKDLKYIWYTVFYKHGGYV